MGRWWVRAGQYVPRRAGESGGHTCLAGIIGDLGVCGFHLWAHHLPLSTQEAATPARPEQCHHKAHGKKGPLTSGGHSAPHTCPSPILPSTRELDFMPLQPKFSPLQTQTPIPTTALRIHTTCGLLGGERWVRGLRDSTCSARCCPSVL